MTPPPVLSRHAAPPPLPPLGRPPAPAPDEPVIDLDARFGDEGASEKSLDEVILSYLAEPPRPKK
jgi:hypothetical protein